MTDREELVKLEAERAELIAKNEASTSWGAAVGARSERIKGLGGRIAALRRLASSDGGVKVRELEWGPHPAGGEQALAAGLGLYRVHRDGSNWYLVPDHMGEGGKAAAQADYEARIRSALVEVPEVKGEQINELDPPWSYVYRYHDGVLRMSGGREINGSKPMEAIGLYLAPDVKRIMEERIRSAPVTSPPADAGMQEALLDRQRYQRLRVLGCAPAYTKHLEERSVLRFTNLDEFVDADLSSHPSRGEAKQSVTEGAYGAAVELAYGLLWVVGCDRSTPGGNALYLARKALLEQLDKSGQSRGITAARKELHDDKAGCGGVGYSVFGWVPPDRGSRADNGASDASAGGGASNSLAAVRHDGDSEGTTRSDGLSEPLTAPGATTKSDGGGPTSVGPDWKLSDDARARLAGKVPCHCHDAVSVRLCLDKDRCYVVEAQPVQAIKMPEYRYQEPDPRGGNVSSGNYGEYTPVTVRGSTTVPVLVDDPNSASGKRVEYQRPSDSSSTRSDVTVELIRALIRKHVTTDLYGCLAGTEEAARALLDQFEIRRK